MKFPTLIQAVLLVIMASIILSMFGAPAVVANAVHTAVGLWFLYGLVTNGPGFETADLFNPAKLKADLMG